MVTRVNAMPEMIQRLSGGSTFKRMVRKEAEWHNSQFVRESRRRGFCACCTVVIGAGMCERKITCVEDGAHKKATTNGRYFACCVKKTVA